MTSKQTKAIRCQTPRGPEKEHSVPIYLTSSYVFDDYAEAKALFAREKQGNTYGRYHNPNSRELATKLAALEEAEAGVCFATGMAAIFNSIMALCQAGDCVVASRCLFGSTVQILTRMLPRWGMSSKFVDNAAPLEVWEAALAPSTDAEQPGKPRLCIIETPSNPTIEVIDLAALAEICHRHKVLLLVDNVYATPFLQTPIKLGADLVMHSATKYIDGQGRTLGGIVVGSEELIAPIEFMLRHAGAALSPFNAWLLSKSLEHLSLRMAQHSENALALAEFLEQQPSVAKVNYPFLPSSPFYSLATKQMQGGAGGTLSFVLRAAGPAGLVAVQQVLDGLQLCSLSANLGDTRTIVTHPATTTHSSLKPAERAAMDISDSLIRVSVGLEDIKDLIADFEQSLAKLQSA